MDVFHLNVGEGPLVAAAIHNGHFLRPQVAELIALDEAERRREEDPYTDYLAEVAPTRLVGARSRFEMDLNRPRDKAVYLEPADAWGLDVWKRALPPEALAASLANYDVFYATVHAVLSQLVARYGRVVVVDIHTYNHRRDGAGGQAADPAENPEVNVGTGTMDRARWAPGVDAFIDAMRSFNYLGRRLDVRENIRFRGGRFSGWIHETFPETVCSIAVEFKKFFMDEWTGEVDRRQLAALRASLESAAPRLLTALDLMHERRREQPDP
jgi:N-formylglutamate amidohydrolase